MLFPPTIAGSLPKPGWLAETQKLWPKWKLEGPDLDQAKRDAALLWIKEQEDAGIETVSDGEQFRTHFVNPKEIDGDVVPHLVNMTKRGADQIGGADYTFDCTGNTKVMRQALESSHRGWGKSVIIGVAGPGRRSPPGRSSL